MRVNFAHESLREKRKAERLGAQAMSSPGNAEMF